MNPFRRALVAAIALAPLASFGQPRFNYSELKPPQPVESPGKIEVIEFFWYGCIHCYNLEPLIENWEKKLPSDVQFRRVPAVINERWAQDAAIFYSLEALGVLRPALVEHRPHAPELRSEEHTSELQSQPNIVCRLLLSTKNR